MGKSIVVYYSRKGNNYFGGKIVNLEVGNTEVVAKKISALTNSDIFEIKTKKDYPADYHETTDIAEKELRANARPEIVGGVSNIEQYDTIYLGYPNWWHTMPMAVFTFLESHNLDGITIAPFCTNEGSGMGSSERDLKKLCPKANIKAGLDIKGSSVNSSDKAIKAWLDKIS